jgi:malate permease and related proteins
MSAALTKTISLLLLIGLGYLFQKKIRGKEQLDGIKTIILSLALPATILIALLQIDFKSELIIIPILTLGFNIAMYLLIRALPFQSIFNISESQYRTLVMLIPSLAPGLSCFPFIIEYSGQGALAMGALADVGNKIFVLIISYTIAMKWYYEINQQIAKKGSLKVKEVLLAMVNEPVNIVIVLAIVMLSLGLGYQSFPAAISLSVDRLSLLMTPLILLFIGLSMRLTWQQVKTILAFLSFRSSIAFLISGLVLYFFPPADVATALLIVVFPQSACSFWPYAHMAAVGQLESKLPEQAKQKTFDQEFAMNVLACSMPCAVLLIMTIYSSGNLFAHAATSFTCSGVLVGITLIVAIASSKKLLAYRTNSLETEANKESTENTITLQES